MLHSADEASCLQRTKNFLSAERFMANPVTFSHCTAGPWSLVSWASLKCAVVFLQNLAITMLKFDIVNFATSSVATACGICHASAQRLSEGLSDHLLTKQTYVYCQRRPLILATSKGALHLFHRQVLWKVKVDQGRQVLQWPTLPLGHLCCSHS